MLVYRLLNRVDFKVTHHPFLLTRSGFRDVYKFLNRAPELCCSRGLLRADIAQRGFEYAGNDLGEGGSST